MEDTIINFGSEIKSLGDNKIGGYLVIFTDETSPDLVGDYFTKDTDFGFEDSIKTAVWLNHRKPLKTRDRKQVTVKEKIGEGTLTKDDNGILIEAILYEREKYEEGLVAMGWSSGTAHHLIEREKKGNANFIKQWYLGLDSSVTPRPCEPRTAVTSLKSWMDELENDETKSDPLEAIIEPSLRAGLRFEQRLDLVLAANERVITDAKEIHEMRQAQKAGRKISKARMDKLREISGQLAALMTEVDGEEVTAEDAPKSVDPSAIFSLVANFEQTKMARFKRV